MVVVRRAREVRATQRKCEDLTLSVGVRKRMDR